MFHRHSVFPCIVLLLSLALAGLIYWSVQSETPSSLVDTQAVQAVDPDTYRDELSDVVKTFEQSMAAAQDDAQRLQAVQTSLTSVLALRVPTPFKDLHLALAVALSDMENTLETGEHDLTRAKEQIMKLKQAYPWIES
jgi:hypothetical protein